jgi:type VI secretion system protein ImpG
MIGYYNQELQHLREVGGEFAREFPKIAGRLNLDEFTCADPYVERLLESFAFMAARVQLKIDAEFPRFTQSLLETLYPSYLAPIPSMTIVQMLPDTADSSLAPGSVVTRGTGLRSQMGKGEQTACEYRTSQDVTLLPLKVSDARYYTRELASLEIPTSAEARAGVRIRLGAGAGSDFNQINLDSLTFFIRAAPEAQMRLYEQLFGHCCGIAVHRLGKNTGQTILPRTCLKPVGFENAEALLPVDARGFSGYRLLQEYFAFPQRFMFFKLTGLTAAAKRCGGSELDLTILFDEPDLRLENNVDATNFALFCTPAINLFPKRCDRIHLSDRATEYQVVADRTRQRDFEIYSITRVTGHGSTSDQEQEFRPFYSAHSGETEGRAFFSLNRVPRMLSTNEVRQGQRSKYAGSETYLSLVDADAAPFNPDLRQLAVEAMCTNRDLPLFVPVGRGTTDFSVDVGAPVVSVKCIAGVPTTPHPSHAHGEFSWRLISHLSLNYLSLIDDDRGPEGNSPGAAALRDLLKLYGDAAEPQIRRQIDGVKSITSKPIQSRVPTPGPITFARGLELTLTFDEAAFEGTGVFLLGSVLEQFFSRYVSINSFTQTIANTMERGEIMKWPARLGRRGVL